MGWPSLSARRSANMPSCATIPAAARSARTRLRHVQRRDAHTTAWGLEQGGRVGGEGRAAPSRPLVLRARAMAAAVIVPYQPHRLRRGGLVERVRNHRFHGVELLRRVVSTVAVGRVTLPLPQGMVSIHSIPPLRRVHRNLVCPIVSHRCLSSPRASAPAAVKVSPLGGGSGADKLYHRMRRATEVTLVMV